MSDSGAPMRTCDGCDACCTVMAVRELDKRDGTPCRHQMGARPGCAIWGEHPRSCQAFHCLWRRHPEVVPQRLFPPDCGFLVSVGDPDAWPVAVQVCPLPGRAHDWSTPENRALFSRLAADWNCVVTVTREGVRASHAFAPSGRVYSRSLHPEVFPQDGARVVVPDFDYGPDRRPLSERRILA